MSEKNDDNKFNAGLFYIMAVILTIIKGDYIFMLYILAIGSNLGDRYNHIDEAISELSVHCLKMIISPLYETAPEIPVDSPKDWYKKFINLALIYHTDYKPDELIKITQSIEKKLGRINDGTQSSPRNIDIDIIFYENEIIESDTLTIPHPRMHQRSFVLMPLCNLTPNYTHPILKKNMIELFFSLEEKFKTETNIKLLPAQSTLHYADTHSQ